MLAGYHNKIWLQGKLFQVEIYNFKIYPSPEWVLWEVNKSNLAFVLLLLMYCFMYLPLFVGVLCWSLFGMHYFFNDLDEEERAGFFALIVFHMSCYCEFCSMALSQGALGWPAVCICGIS